MSTGTKYHMSRPLLSSAWAGCLGVMFCIAAMAAGGTTPGSSIMARAEVSPSLVESGHPVTYTITFDGVRSLSPPRLSFPDGLMQLGPPSQQFSLYMGTAGQSLSSSLSYRLLPTRPGEYRIGPYNISLAGTNVTVPAVNLKVVGSHPTSAGHSTTSPPPLFLRARVLPENPYVDQWCRLELELFASPDVDLSDRVELLNVGGKDVLVTPPRELPPEQRALQDRVYRVRRFYLYIRPTAPGPLTLTPALRVNIVVPRRRQPPPSGLFGPSLFPDFDELFFGGTETHPYVLQAPEVSLTCRPLPLQDRPPDFSGAVGDFILRAEVSPTNVNIGDPITLKVTISGTGNVETVSCPPYEPGPAFKTYPPALTAKQASSDGRSGSRTFELVIIPSHPGTTNLPPVSFAFFDPQQQRYRRVSAGPFTVAVTGAAPAVATAAPGTRSSSQNPITSRDILFLKPSPSWFWEWSLSGSVWAYLIVNCFPLAVFIAAWGWDRERRRLLSDRRYSHAIRAAVETRHAMKQAAIALRSGDRRAFYAALWRALQSGFAPLSPRPDSHLTHDDIRRLVSEKPSLRRFASSIPSLLQRLEAVQYAPPGQMDSISQEQMREDIKQVRSILRQCRKMLP